MDRPQVPFGNICPFPVPRNPTKTYDLGVLPPNASGESTKCCQFAPFLPMYWVELAHKGTLRSEGRSPCKKTRVPLWTSQNERWQTVHPDWIPRKILFSISVSWAVLGVRCKNIGLHGFRYMQLMWAMQSSHASSFALNPAHVTTISPATRSSCAGFSPTNCFKLLAAASHICRILTPLGVFLQWHDPCWKHWLPLTPRNFWGGILGIPWRRSLHCLAKDAMPLESSSLQTFSTSKTKAQAGTVATSFLQVPNFWSAASLATTAGTWWKSCCNISLEDVWATRCSDASLRMVSNFCLRHAFTSFSATRQASVVDPAALDLSSFAVVASLSPSGISALLSSPKLAWPSRWSAAPWRKSGV